MDEDDEDYEDFGEDDDYEYGESGHFGLPVCMLPSLPACWFASGIHSGRRCCCCCSARTSALNIEDVARGKACGTKNACHHGWRAKIACA